MVIKCNRFYFCTGVHRHIGGDSEWQASFTFPPNSPHSLITQDSAFILLGALNAGIAPPGQPIIPENVEVNR